MMKRFGCLYFDVIVLMGNCLHATHHRNAFSSPLFFFLKKVSKAEGGLVAMDIWNFMFTFEEVSWNLRYLVSTWVAVHIQKLQDCYWLSRAQGRGWALAVN